MNKMLVLTCLVPLLSACVSSPQVTSTQIPASPTARQATPLSPTPLPDIQFNPLPTPDYESTTRWLKGVPCRLPCWEGVTPGQTRGDEAVEILKHSPIIASVVMTTYADLWPDVGYISWQYTNVDESWIRGNAVYNLRSPTATISTLNPNSPNNIRLGDVMQVYGEPSHVLARALRNPHNDGFTFDLRIIYRDQGFVLTESSLSRLNLTEDTLFEALSLFAPADEEAFKKSLAGGAATLDWIQPWQGIRNFEFYCRDPEDGAACQAGR